MSRTALVLSGGGRYADRWHPFAETSQRIAAIVQDQGYDVEISADIDRRLSRAGGADMPGLMVLNIGDPSQGEAGPSHDDLDGSAREGLLRYLRAGHPLLAFHSSATSLASVPEWEEILGGVWVRGTSMHPEYSRARIRVHSDRHPIVSGLHDFDVSDERYTYLRTAPDLVPLATHEHDGSEFPLIWARKYGSARVVYDALGHDTASYDSQPHRELIARAVRWLDGRSV